MPLSNHVHELRLAIGSPRAVVRKLADAGSSLVTMANPRERDRRYARLQAAGLAGPQPSTWQLVQGAHHMLFGYLLPSNLEFYEAFGRNHHWAQVLRILDEPSAMIDPIGLGLKQEMIISHLVQVTHSSAGYDVALLLMFEDGLGALRRELEQLVDGEHPRQEAIDAIIEREDYHWTLLEALDRFEADPETHWRVATVPAPEGCEALFDWGIDTFGTPGRLFAYCNTLPKTPADSLHAWIQGELSVPTPA